MSGSIRVGRQRPRQRRLPYIPTPGLGSARQFESGVLNAVVERNERKFNDA